MSTYLIERRYGRNNRDYLAALSTHHVTWSVKPAALGFQDIGVAYAAMGLVHQLAKTWPDRAAFAFVIIEQEVQP
jgi:hypothetical protein